jgi:hypothetical protein
VEERQLLADLVSLEGETFLRLFDSLPLKKGSESAIESSSGHRDERRSQVREAFESPSLFPDLTIRLELRHEDAALARTSQATQPR